MFAVSIYGFNLNDNTTKYFNVTLRQTYYSPLLIPINSTLIPLV